MRANDEPLAETMREVERWQPCEDYIRSINWRPSTPDDVRTLVAGNIRGFFGALLRAGEVPPTGKEYAKVAEDAALTRVALYSAQILGVRLRDALRAATLRDRSQAVHDLLAEADRIGVSTESASDDATSNANARASAAPEGGRHAKGDDMASTEAVSEKHRDEARRLIGKWSRRVIRNAEEFDEVQVKTEWLVNDVAAALSRVEAEARDDLREDAEELYRALTVETEAVAALRAEVEQLRVQLAGCSVAAHGNATGDNDCTRGMYGWSVAFDDVKRLRREYDALRAVLAPLQELAARAMHGRVEAIWLSECEIAPHVVMAKRGGGSYTICTPVHSTNATMANMKLVAGLWNALPALLKIAGLSERDKA